MTCNGVCEEHGRRFLFPNQQLSFTDASRFCQARRAQLLTSFDDVTTTILHRTCCNLRNLNQKFWIGLRRNNQQCRSEQFPYQRIGNGQCVNGNSLLISRQQNSNCVALRRSNRNDRKPRAGEFPCQNRFRFICYSGRITSATTTPSTTPFIKTTSTTTRSTRFTATTTQSTTPAGRRIDNVNSDYFNTTRTVSTGTDNTKILDTSIDAVSSTERLLVRGAIGGGVALLLLLIILAIISVVCKNSKKKPSLQDMAKRKQSKDPIENSYYRYMVFLYCLLGLKI